jgi:glycosyltransferase involved in cell wall biosynthesis
MDDTAILVTTCGRPSFLERTLSHLVQLDVPILVVNDPRDDAPFCGIRPHDNERVKMMTLPSNRGLAAALNIGLSYWLADASVKWISYFQDDVEVDPDVLEALRDVQHHRDRPLLTGHDAVEHKPVRRESINGIDFLVKQSCRATHMHASRDYWIGVSPIPTRELGAPKRIEGQERGMGSNVDWWIASWAPNSAKETGKPVVCIPNLVRTFSKTKEDSTWDNGLKYDEPALSRAALKGWRK